ncbi:MAG: organomercurial lyase [Gaiellaceae bacterium]
MQSVPDAGAATALEMAAIRPERRGRRRLSSLTQPERELYHWILQRFAASVPPSGQATRATALELGLDPAEALAALARDDLVHTDRDGRPVVAYPFSARERGHRVLIDETREVEAMCAIDALGIAPMLGLPIEVRSRDPISGGEVHVQLQPGEQPDWQPKKAVVLAGSTHCEGPSFGGCCDVLNFFETSQNAERYLREHREINGAPTTIPAAAEAGRLVFGDVLGED